jgi:starch phosphorylase
MYKMNSDETVEVRGGRSVDAFKQAMEDHLYYSRGSSFPSASASDAQVALSYTVRDFLMDRWRRTASVHYEENPKFVYYLSAEYLLGRQLTQNVLYTGTAELVRQALAEYDLVFEDLVDLDPEPGLGNGGLGRLAACYLDSMATLDIPCVGYGMRYEFGIFKQTFDDGWQVERPDNWLHYGNPWEFAQPDDMVEVGFGGHTENYLDEEGRYRVRWVPGQKVLGEPYHTMVPGYKTGTVNMLRLWRARASKEFDFQLFDVGDYARAVEQKVSSENITKVLYPNDNTPQGKELRLQQQYFFVACSLHDIIRRFHIRNQDWSQFAEKVVIQLNDTHPVVAIPELMRILVDDYALGWDRAWRITSRTFAYTAHTLLPEALEKWPVSLFERLLPRHLQIIYEINHRFLQEVRNRYPEDVDRVRRISIIEEAPERQVRMAHLASVGSFSINGVAELQSRLLRERTLHDFGEMWPEKFNNKTNGVTPRRFIELANPRLATLISSKIGDDWSTDLSRLSRLEQHIDEAQFRKEWREIKRRNKADLADHILAQTGVEVDPNSIFDIMVKRLHEYKRQLLKALHIMTLYNRIKSDPHIEIVPRTFVFGAKAAPGYYMAKLIIKLINSVAEVVNHDPELRERLKVAFLPNFNVSAGERIYPAADISEQISMAGTEASGTGNMKFALNGAVTTGTLDGANIEIRELVGKENFFLFGLTSDEVFSLKESGYNPMDYYHGNSELKAAIDQIASGFFSNGDEALFKPLVDSLLNQDEYLLLADYQSYIECQDRVAQAYLDEESWTRMSILNVARCGFFSSDRSIRQYCEGIWNVQPVHVELE